VRAAVLGAVSLLLAVVIVRSELAAAWATTQPARAVELNPLNVEASAELARLRYFAGDDETAARLAREGLRASPLDVPSLRVLGWLASREGDRERARALFEAAAARSWRDVPTQLWLWEDKSAARRYAEAVPHIDAALRVAPAERPRLFPTWPSP
jgi:tetratricopeptide (TPR) repeat protein